jgi:hypothetical protein
VGEAVYALEAKRRNTYTGDRTAAAMFAPPAPRNQPTSEVVLARHTKDGRDVILELSLGEGSVANRYCASEDRKRFVLQVDGKRPRLIIIPIREKVDAKDLMEIPIGAQ